MNEQMGFMKNGKLTLWAQPILRFLLKKISEKKNKLYLFTNRQTFTTL